MGNARLDAHHLAVFERSNGDIVLATPQDATAPLDCIVLTGEPIDESTVRYGPFVMNTEAEIHEAIADFNAGRTDRFLPLARSDNSLNRPTQESHRTEP